MKDSENRLAFEYVHSDGGRSIKIVEPIMIEFEQSSNLEGWFLEGIDVATNLRQKFLMKSIQRVIDVFPQRFLCVTVYVFNSQNKLLMVLNKNLGKWVPPGGKVDNHETPDEAAIRECFEETGVNIELVGEKPSFDGALVTPIGSQCNTIKCGIRDHVDLIYVGKPQNESNKPSMADRECSGLGWFSVQEIELLDTFDSVRYWMTKILQIHKTD